MATLREAIAARARTGKGSLLAYLMGGSVPPETYLETVDVLCSAGLTGLEVGFPFSDPMAEGPVIQKAASDALAAGMRWEGLLRFLPQVASRVPCAVMTYLNVLQHRGIPVALGDLAAAGASAVIVPDLPVEESAAFRSAGRKVGVDVVLLASPATSEERLRTLARRTGAFLYLVSRYGTTGVTNEKSLEGARTGPELSPLISAVHRDRPGLPVLVGFGVSTPEDVRRYRAMGADGVIVGSALQQLVARKAPSQEIADLARALAGALEETHG